LLGVPGDLLDLDSLGQHCLSEVWFADAWSIHNVFHTSFLLPYHENPVHGPNFPAPPPDLIEGEEEFEILLILRHKGPLNNHLYLIRWKGYTAKEDTWIPERELKHAKTALLTYKKAHPITFPKTNPLS
jgi:hypothetical protein